MFKENFVRICTEKGLSPSNVCIEAGISKSNYSNWNESSVPRKTTLIKIAKILNVDVSELTSSTYEGESKRQVMTFYDRIIDLCVKTNINKTTLEKKLGFSQNSVNKWKTSTPSVKKVQQLADFFNVTPAYLMGFETDKPYEEKKAEAKSLVSDLTPEEIKKVQEYIVFLKSQRKK